MKTRIDKGDKGAVRVGARFALQSLHFWGINRSKHSLDPLAVGGVQDDALLIEGVNQ